MLILKNIQSFISSNPCEPQCQALGCSKDALSFQHFFSLLLALYDDIEVKSLCHDFVHISVATATHNHRSNLFFWSQPIIKQQQQKQHTAYWWRVDGKTNLCKATLYFRETNMPPI